MHFNLYLDDDTGARLDRVLKRLGVTRNALIRTAIAEWLERQADGGWPREVLDFQGLPDFEGPEAHRGDLLPPSGDPLR